MELRKIVACIVGLLGMVIAVKMPFIPMIGSFGRFFSFNAIVIPGSALIGGSVVGLLCTLLRLLAFVAAGKASMVLSVQILPGFCVLLASSKRYYFLNYVIPLLAIFLFVLNPVGASVVWYALYWTVPLVITYCGYQSLFAQALSMSFIAHAVGSVIWIYTVPMTVADYYALAVMVPFERLIIASSIYGYCTLVQYIASAIKKLASSRQVCSDVVGR